MNEDRSRKEITAAVTFPPITAEVELRVRITSVVFVQPQDFYEDISKMSRLILVKAHVDGLTRMLLDSLKLPDTPANHDLVERDMVIVLKDRIDRTENDPLSR